MLSFQILYFYQSYLIVAQHLVTYSNIPTLRDIPFHSAVHRLKETNAIISSYCTSWNFRGGFIFANFASQTLAKISTSIYVYL